MQLGRQVEEECNKIAKDYRLVVRQNYTVGRGWHLIVNRRSLPKEIPADFMKVRNTKFNTYFTTEKLGSFLTNAIFALKSMLDRAERTRT